MTCSRAITRFRSRVRSSFPLPDKNGPTGGAVAAARHAESADGHVRADPDGPVRADPSVVAPAGVEVGALRLAGSDTSFVQILAGQHRISGWFLLLTSAAKESAEASALMNRGPDARDLPLATD